MSDWFPADKPPSGEKGFWTRRVIVVTNIGNAYSGSYFHGEEFGCWQHPRAFDIGEKITQWTEFPEDRE